MALFRWRGCGCRNRVLTVEVGNKRPRDVDALRRVQQRHLRSVDDYIDAASLGESLEGVSDFSLQRRKQFLAATIVSSLRVLALALNIFFQLLELIDLGL